MQVSVCKLCTTLMSWNVQHLGDHLNNTYAKTYEKKVQCLGEAQKKRSLKITITNITFIAFDRYESFTNTDEFSKRPN